MATTTPSPNFATFFSINEEIEEVRRDIALLSYLLANVNLKNDKKNSRQNPFRVSPPKPDPRQPWVHLAFILSAGDPHHLFASNKPVAVTGKVENDAITVALVGPGNASLRHSPDQLCISELKLDTTNGRRLIGSPSSITTDVSFSQHATDVFSVLRFFFSTFPDEHPMSSSKWRIPRLAMFITRRCYRKLQAYVHQGTQLWNDHPLKLIHAWYHPSQTNSGVATSHPQLLPRHFALPSEIQESLAEFGLHPDENQSSSPSAADKLTYTVSQDTATLWTTMLRRFLQTMLDSYTSDPWTSQRFSVLWQAVALLRETLMSGILDHLITPDLSRHLGEARQHSRQGRSRLKDAILLSAPAHAAATNEMHEQAIDGDGEGTGHHHRVNDDILDKDRDENEDNVDNAESNEVEDIEGNRDNEQNTQELEEDVEDEDNVYYSTKYGTTTGVHETPKDFVLRYLRKLCIAVDAAVFYSSYAKQLAKHDMQLQTYVLTSKPESIPPITAATVREFASRFTSHFSLSLGQVTSVAAAFEKLANDVEKIPFDAVEHAEAIIMALACASAVSDMGSALGMETESKATTTVQSVFQAAQVPVGVVKKCCFCCHTLATLLKEHAGLDFVLQDTHSTIFPWVPPRGIPLDVLQKLRLTLLRVLYDTVKKTVDSTIRPTQTSPADSVLTESGMDYKDQFDDLGL